MKKMIAEKLHLSLDANNKKGKIIEREEQGGRER